MFQSGWGFLPLQKLDKVQVAFLMTGNLPVSFKMARRGGRAPALRTKSLKAGESPAILPKAQTACSLTSSASDSRSLTNFGMAPLSTTTLVCSVVPEAIFVTAQAASN